jgi:hypothetical protein
VLANVLQHVLAFLPNLFGCLTHRGGRDARVPVRAAAAFVGYADAIHQESPPVGYPSYVVGASSFCDRRKIDNRFLGGCLFFFVVCNLFFGVVSILDFFVYWVNL